MCDAKKCEYCRKPVEAGKEVKRTLLYFCGNNLARKEKEYCSKQCAEKDQMAHEA
ncbi:DNA breaking-rejoining protein [Enterobacter hormaechei]|nr:YdaE family protein [Enterobacter hormaechei]KYH17923.1 DNA breaking-rejoining protein [Enterobacter hormaechei]